MATREFKREIKGRMVKYARKIQWKNERNRKYTEQVQHYLHSGWFGWLVLGRFVGTFQITIIREMQLERNVMSVCSVHFN